MTPQEAYEKCLREKKRISELENIIVTDLDYSYRYARDIIKRPWERGEEAISKDSEYSYLYALHVIEGPWERGEEVISKDPIYSYWYASNVIKGPFQKCHHIILNSSWRNNYLDFLKSIKYDYSEWLI